MNLFGIWIVTATLGVVVCVVDVLTEPRITQPRETMRKLAWRLLVAIFWPIAIPIYLTIATWRNEW